MAGLSGVTSQIFGVVVVVVLAMYRYSGLCLVTIGVVIHCIIGCIVAIVFAMHWCDGLCTDISVGVVVVTRFSADHSGVGLVDNIAFTPL